MSGTTKNGHLGGDIITYKDQLIAIGGGRKSYYYYSTKANYDVEHGGNRKVEVLENRVAQDPCIFIDIPKRLFFTFYTQKAYKRCAKSRPFLSTFNYEFRF